MAFSFLGDKKNMLSNLLTELQVRTKGFTAKIGCILGSGLGDFSKQIKIQHAVDYHALEGMPKSTVAGHAGQWIFGELNGVPIICMNGRFHMYEGHRPQDIAIPIRLMRKMGVETLLLSNASGSLDPEVGPGRLRMIADHINFQIQNPLLGANDDTVGPRFVPMNDAYDPVLRQIFKDVAAEEGILLPEGVFLGVMGPQYETPAEIRAFRLLGADLVAMSTIPEVIAARHCGMRVAAISVITNMAAGLSKEAPSHEEVIVYAKQASEQFIRLFKGVISRLT